jgi:hypothetical protein
MVHRALRWRNGVGSFLSRNLRIRGFLPRKDLSIGTKYHFRDEASLRTDCSQNDAEKFSRKYFHLSIIYYDSKFFRIPSKFV